jgi:FkbM family methyltransferase
MIIPGFIRRWDRRLNQRFFSLNDLDRKLQRYVDFDGGFFIEAGGNDGIDQSNTLHFERYRNWRGLLIEPVPALAWRCRLFRPGSVTVNAALGSFDQSGTPVEMTYCNLMSTIDGAMSSIEEQAAHIETGARIQSLRPYRLTVPRIALTEILARYEIGRVDLFSLDVEGYEENVLRGLDFDRFRPRYILVEARYRSRVENVIGPSYETVAELTDRDILYRSRINGDSTVSWGWRYSRERRLGHLMALSRVYAEPLDLRSRYATLRTWLARQRSRAARVIRSHSES